MAVAKRHRVLALVTDAFGGYGGIAQYNRDFLRAIAEGGACDVYVLPRVGDAVETPLPHGITQGRPKIGRVRYLLHSLLRAFRFRPTIVFCGHLYHAPLAAIIALAFRSKFVGQLHGTEVWEELRTLDRVALEHCDLILTVSRDTRRRVVAAVNVEPEKVRVLNNTVANAFVPGEYLAARQKFGLHRETVILTVSRLDNRKGYKGHDRILAIMPELRSRGLDVLYLIAGDGPDGVRLKGIVQEKGLTDCVRFLGRVPACDLPDLYRAANIFALPSTGEGFGIAFLEAMASGTMAIGINVGGTADALADGELGMCVPPDQFERAFSCLVESDSAAPATLPARVRQRFGWETFRAQCEELVLR